MLCDDSEKISRLVKLLAGADREMQSGCPFYSALYLSRSDGTIGTVFPATDSCAMYLTDKGCYKFSESSNGELWIMIGEFELVNKG